MNRYSSLPTALPALSVSLTLLLIPWTTQSRADYVYAGTQLSWEWLTDASRAIVVGKVTTCDKAGKFRLEVERVLKRRGLDVEVGQTVGGPTLGRSGLYILWNHSYGMSAGRP
jgi:hypothetical protein